MKKVLLFIFLITSVSSFAQIFSPLGATWHYGLDYDAWVKGYYKIRYASDTTINTISCKKLVKEVYWRNLGIPNSTVTGGVFGSEFIYSDSDKVYIYKHNQFYTLYDFGAPVGSTWVVPEINNYGTGCDTTGIVKVDSIGTMVINNQTLRYIRVSLLDTAQKWGWNDRIVERIGPLHEYLFPVYYGSCGMTTDGGPEGGELRCYSDSSLFNYQPNLAFPCDYVTSVESNLKLQNDINVFPNPSNGSFTINSPKDNLDRIKIVNILGKVIYDEIAQDKKQVIIDDLTAGTYFVSIKNLNQETTIIKVIKF